MGGMEAVMEEEESTPPYSQCKANELLSPSGESKSSVTSVELLALVNVAPIPVVRGVVWSPRRNHLSLYVLVLTTHYRSSLCTVHAALSNHTVESGLGVTLDST